MSRHPEELTTHAQLQARREAVVRRHRETYDRVHELAQTHDRIGESLGSELQTLEGHGRTLDALQEEAAETGFIAALVRTFSARNATLSRRSVTEGLTRQYEAVSARLREATAFSDELRLCAAELQEEVDGLYRDEESARRNLTRVVERLRALELELAQASTPREIDRLTFQKKDLAVQRALFEAAIEHCLQHLPAARKLRDTVQRLHEEMAKYVLAATQTVNSAGRRIQGLGMVADAPVVVGELQASLGDLEEAMAATRVYVDQSRAFFAEVLPELTQELKANAEVAEMADAQELDALTDAVSAQLADQALRNAADDEVDRFLGRKL